MSVLNVFKTSVDTINASSITSDMTIGANLNGGSLTLGNINSVTNISSSITNIGKFGLPATGRVFIASETNTSGSYVHIGSSTLSGLYLRGKDVLINYQQGTPQAPVYTYIGNDTAGSTNIVGQTNIANTGLSTNDGVNIATNGYGTSSYVTIGSANFPQIYMRSFNTRINDDGGNCYLGKDNSGRVELRGSIVVLNGQGGDLNLGGVSSGTINLYRPLTPIYPISFTSGQIGYSSSSQAGGSLVNSTYNNLLMGTLTGVYMISCRSYVAAGSFTGVTTYDFQMGLNGVGELTRCYLGGSNLNYSNNQQTLSMLYSSSGPTNPGSALLYANVFITWTSSTGGPIWGITIFYTRVA